METGALAEESPIVEAMVQSSQGATSVSQVKRGPVSPVHPLQVSHNSIDALLSSLIGGAVTN